MAKILIGIRSGAALILFPFVANTRRTFEGHGRPNAGFAMEGKHSAGVLLRFAPRRAANHPANLIRDFR
jgi:hypothetical protein